MGRGKSGRGDLLLRRLLARPLNLVNDRHYVMLVRFAATAVCLLACGACAGGGGSESAQTVTVTQPTTGGGETGSAETVTVTVTAPSGKAVNLVVTDEDPALTTACRSR